MGARHQRTKAGVKCGGGGGAGGGGGRGGVGETLCGGNAGGGIVGGNSSAGPVGSARHLSFLGADNSEARLTTIASASHEAKSGLPARSFSSGTQCERGCCSCGLVTSSSEKISVTVAARWRSLSAASYRLALAHLNLCLRHSHDFGHLLWSDTHSWAARRVIVARKTSRVRSLANAGLPPLGAGRPSNDNLTEQTICFLLFVCSPTQGSVID